MAQFFGRTSDVNDYSHKAVNEFLGKYKDSFIYKRREEELMVMREKMINIVYSMEPEET
jgi:hypothetical protein